MNGEGNVFDIAATINVYGKIILYLLSQHIEKLIQNMYMNRGAETIELLEENIGNIFLLLLTN